MPPSFQATVAPLVAPGASRIRRPLRAMSTAAVPAARGALHTRVLPVLLEAEAPRIEREKTSRRPAVYIATLPAPIEPRV